MSVLAGRCNSALPSLDLRAQPVQGYTLRPPHVRKSAIQSAVCRSCLSMGKPIILDLGENATPNLKLQILLDLLPDTDQVSSHTKLEVQPSARETAKMTSQWSGLQPFNRGKEEWSVVRCPFKVRGSLKRPTANVKGACQWMLIHKLHWCLPHSHVLDLFLPSAL